jgi:hypothetical protein
LREPSLFGDQWAKPKGAGHEGATTAKRRRRKPGEKPKEAEPAAPSHRATIEPAEAPGADEPPQ